MSIYNALRDAFGGSVMTIDDGGHRRRVWRLDDDAGSITVYATPYHPRTPTAEPVGWDAQIVVSVTVPDDSPIEASNAMRWLVEQDAIVSARAAVRRATAAILAGAAMLARPSTPGELDAETRRYLKTIKGKIDPRPEAARDAACRRRRCQAAVSAALGIKRSEPATNAAPAVEAADA